MCTHFCFVLFLPSVHIKVKCMMIKYKSTTVIPLTSVGHSQSTLLLLVYTFIIIIRRKSSFGLKDARCMVYYVLCIFKKPNQMLYIYLHIRNGQTQTTNVRMFCVTIIGIFVHVINIMKTCIYIYKCMCSNV